MGIAGVPWNLGVPWDSRSMDGYECCGNTVETDLTIVGFPQE